MKKRSAMFLAAAMAAFGAWAETETVGGYTWTYRINGGTAEIFNDYSAAISPKPTGAVTIPSTLGGKPVTNIGESAFAWCSGLTSVTIPNSVTNIGESAFAWCSGLTSVTIPNSVTCIGDSAFSNCSGLTKVTIPVSVTNIGNSAFSDCGRLASVTIPSSVTRIPDDAFHGCSSLKSVIIPNSVLDIGNGAFAGCSGLKSVIIPDGVISIGQESFYNCSGLTSVSIPNSVTSTGRYVFSDCSGLTSVTIGNGLGIIMDFAFYNCSNLKSVTIPNSVAIIGDRAFSGCNGLMSVTIQNSATDISQYAFWGCGGLSVYLPVDYNGSLEAFDLAVVIRYKKQQCVTFDAYGGSVSNVVKVVDYGAMYGSLPLPSRVGYAFEGWAWNEKTINSESIVSALDDHVLIAQWKVNRYMVTFDANGGTGGKSVTRDYGTDLASPIVTRTGYTFAGWTPEVAATVPASNVTYTAQWTANRYGIRFDANGGEGKMDGVDSFYSHEFMLTSNVFSRIEHAFVGWSRTENGDVLFSDGEIVSNLTATANGIVTLYAVWLANQYVITFDENGGTGGKSLMQDYGTEITAPTVTRMGYMFKGWSPEVDATVPASNVTYTAQWKINQYDVTFNANGGTGGKSVTQDYGTVLVAPAVTRTGYTFTGWSPSVPSTVPADAGSDARGVYICWLDARSR